MAEKEPAHLLLAHSHPPPPPLHFLQAGRLLLLGQLTSCLLVSNIVGAVTKRRCDLLYLPIEQGTLLLPHRLAEGGVDRLGLVEHGLCLSPLSSLKVEGPRY